MVVNEWFRGEFIYSNIPLNIQIFKFSVKYSNFQGGVHSVTEGTALLLDTDSHFHHSQVKP